MKIALFASLIVSALSWSGEIHAQEVLDVRFLSSQRTTASPFSLPVYVNSNGDVSFFNGSETKELAFNPKIQAGYSRAIIEYSSPVVMNHFNFYPVERSSSFIEVRRSRIEGGLGLAAVMKRAVSVGLVPYRGATSTIVRRKAQLPDKSLIFKMPKNLSELANWSVGDFGLFQAYGGIELYAGINASIIDIASGSVGMQNQFVIEMKKISSEVVELSLAEEDLKRRQFILGPFFTEGTRARFNGKRFTSVFKLNLNNHDHHKLFREGINGNIKLLQEELPMNSQKVVWEGKDSAFFYGIPGLLGKQRTKGHYEMNENEVESELEITGRRNSGYLTTLRNHNNYVYQNDKNIVILWTSEMNKADKKAVEYNFFSKGRLLGVKGFQREIPEQQKFGSVVSQLAVSFTKGEVEALKNISEEDVRDHLSDRCEELELSCRNERNLGKIMKDLKVLIVKPWKEMRGELGLLFIREPVLVHAILKTMRLKKEAYFKFLSEKYQSLEGSTPVEI